MARRISIIRIFKNNLHYFCKDPKNCIIYLKTHPSENHNKYDKWISDNSHLKLKLLPVNEELSNLYQGLISGWMQHLCNGDSLKAKIKVASTIPRYGPKCDLPFKEIVKIRDLE